MAKTGGKLAEKQQNNSDYDGSTPLKGRREKFAQCMAEGTYSQIDCCRMAGYTDNKGLQVYASKLITYSNVKKRIAYLQAEIADLCKITREGQAKKLAAARIRAIEAADRTNEIAAIKEENKLFGLSTDRIVHEDRQDEYSQERIKQAKDAARQDVERLKLRRGA